MELLPRTEVIDGAVRNNVNYYGTVLLYWYDRTVSEDVFFNTRGNVYSQLLSSDKYAMNTVFNIFVSLEGRFSKFFVFVLQYR